MSSVNKKIALVGAGPGDPELITLKAIKALGNAKVVLYDALIDTDLLDHAPKAKKVFVGKRKGNHRYTQEEINQLAVQYALSTGDVVRLKGGDPFIFGRGAEELDYLQAFGVEVEIIPGISSSYAVPASQHISLTKRGVAESFWVITGTNRAGQLPKDIELAAQSNATVVILMGMTNLPEIVARFQRFGKGNVPTAVIQNGTTPKEKRAVGRIDSIVDQVAIGKVSSPAIIVIGEVVAHSPKLAQILEEVESENVKR